MSKYRIVGFGQRCDFPIDGEKFPLILTAREGNIGKLRNLIAEGVDVNDQTPHEETALGWAKARSDKVMVKILKKAGARK
jgi:ankyrin repeat protein